MTTADINEMKKALSLLLAPGQVTELRALDVPAGTGNYRGTASGYFDDPDALANAALILQGASGIYIIPNPIQVDLLARRKNRIDMCRRGNSTTSDTDIIQRRWLFIDCDPDRPSGIPSTVSLR